MEIKYGVFTEVVLLLVATALTCLSIGMLVVMVDFRVQDFVRSINYVSLTAMIVGVSLYLVWLNKVLIRLWLMEKGNPSHNA